jgi:predicted TIM-barrel fold metal-dependent hydrolase
VISLPPLSFGNFGQSCATPERLAHLCSWCDVEENLFPFYWLDPLEKDAFEQIDMAIERGVLGFKVICDRFYPGDSRVLPVFQRIADRQRPILFHSGILWDGKPSGQYNRPVEFEALLEVKGLRFSLAHISWPWCDELIAVYGKFLNAHVSQPDLSVEMFIDITPGTPRIYRRQALTNVLTVGYDVQQNLIFGSDCTASEYHVEWVDEWISRDRAIFTDLDLTKREMERIFSGNLKRFVGISTQDIQKTYPKPGE